EFEDAKDAEHACQKLNGALFQGDRLIVEMSRPERRRSDFRRDDRDRDHHRDRDSHYSHSKYGPPQRTNYRIIVENLASNASWQDLKDFMRRGGDVVYADCHRDREGEGVVEFSSYEDMKSALRKLDDEEFKGRPVYLKEDKSSRNRSRSPPPRQSYNNRGHSGRNRSRSPEVRDRERGSRRSGDGHRDRHERDDREYRRRASPGAHESGMEGKGSGRDRKVEDHGRRGGRVPVDAMDQD
ncbi:Serine/arginine-rich splicing factor 6, partial [Blyttiomyces sp. JEL0837]